MIFYNQQHGNLELTLPLQVFGSWPVHCRERNPSMSGFLATVFLSGCSCCFVAAAPRFTGEHWYSMSCSSAPQLCMISLGSLAVLHEHCAVLRSPVCTLAQTSDTDCFPSMQAGGAMASAVDPLCIAPFISEPSQLFPSASSLSYSECMGCHCIPGSGYCWAWPLLPRQYFTRLPNFTWSHCSPHSGKEWPSLKHSSDRSLSINIAYTRQKHSLRFLSLSHRLSFLVCLRASWSTAVKLYLVPVSPHFHWKAPKLERCCGASLSLQIPNLGLLTSL